ncbi:MAG: D-glycerate dehydrogenase [Candidatus Bathyarchaeota archaeon]|nr:D-glycerate dehydrogenase [Candidatus Bathyarchaeota archaeon]
MKPKIMVSPSVRDDNPGLLEERLSDIAELVFNTFRGSEDIPSEIKDSEAMILGLEPVNKDVLRNFPKLKIIARYGVGYDNVDVSACTKRGIYVTHTPGVLSHAVAELTIGLMICLSRRLVEADNYVRTMWANKHKKFKLEMGTDLYGKTLGIIGLGRIGYEVAVRAKAFGMKIIYYDIERKSEAEKTLEARYVDLETLLKESDFLTIHVPLTSQTRNMIGEKELRLMKPTAYIINTSRGAVIDEEALCRALKECWIAGAGLDVFVSEPLPFNSPLINMRNVVLAPHIGTYTVETRRKMALMCIENVRAVLMGKTPPNPVPEQRGFVFKR